MTLDDAKRTDCVCSSPDVSILVRMADAAGPYRAVCHHCGRRGTVCTSAEAAEREWDEHLLHLRQRKLEDPRELGGSAVTGGFDPFVGISVRVLPAELLRVETGPVRFGDDWPGVFIRGDDAFAWCLSLAKAADLVEDPMLLADLLGLGVCLSSAREEGAEKGAP